MSINSVWLAHTHKKIKLFILWQETPDLCRSLKWHISTNSFLPSCGKQAVVSRGTCNASIQPGNSQQCCFDLFLSRNLFILFLFCSESYLFCKRVLASACWITCDLPWLWYNKANTWYDSPAGFIGLSFCHGREFCCNLSSLYWLRKPNCSRQ